MNMKLPLYQIILIIAALAIIIGLIFTARTEVYDSTFKELGETTYHEAQIKSWKTGSCYVFGVKYTMPEGQPHGNQPPVFFSNCQK